jgi:hypothetical protein
VLFIDLELPEIHAMKVLSPSQTNDMVMVRTFNALAAKSTAQEFLAFASTQRIPETLMVSGGP